jgi:2',3'-cyclic-nucleotide 2'-phosphodiesterase (5'-nucleotidase family)
MFKFFKMKKTMSLGIAALLSCSLMFPSVAIAETTSSNGAVIDLTANAKVENLKSGQEIIQILATADSHGRFLPYDYAINSVDTQGSLAQIATAVNQLRNENPNNTILVDAGDTIQDNSASLFLNDTLNPMMLAMNEIGYDAITFGNHEFNYGVPVLKNIAKQFSGAALCGNVYDKDGNRIAAPYTIVEKSGVKVGIIGMVTPNITRWDSANLQEYKVTNPVD